MLLGIVLHAAMSFMPMAWIVQDSRQHAFFGQLVSFVHGFRMPLFFLLSGFFTAMLWKRRGLPSLLRQRTTRVLVPCLLGLVTIHPLMTHVADWAIERQWGSDSDQEESQEAGSAPPVQMPDEDIWTAAAWGSVYHLEQFLADGVDVNEQDPTFQQAPLAIASAFDRPAAVEFLLARGANVDFTNSNGDTALHAATFFGYPKVTRILLNAGADLSLKNVYGSTAVDNLDTHWDLVSLIAGMIRLELEEEAVMAGREEIRGLLKGRLGADGQLLPEAAQEPGWHERLQDATLALKRRPLVAENQFDHLWFLWDLCFLVILFALLTPLLSRIPFGDWVHSPRNLLWLVPLTAFPQSLMGLEFSFFGPDTTTGWIPMPTVLGYYAIFFLFGSLYYLSDDRTSRLGRRWPFQLGASALAFAFGYEFTTGSWGFCEDLLDPAHHRAAAVLLQVLFAWWMSFGLLGLFRRLLSHPSRRIRWVSDSSNWLYLAHLPLVVWLQVQVASWDLHPGLKLLLLTLVASVLLLLSYRYLVRYTPLGRLLNGPRSR